MIKDRPDTLLADPCYREGLGPPYALDWRAVPELVRASMLDLGGIQPVTRAMAEAAGGALLDTPSEGEIALFRERGTQFQMISVIASTLAIARESDFSTVTPFALSLLPASKRGAVSIVGIDYIAAIEGGEKWREAGPGYAGYDPFSGEWGLYGPLGLVAGNGKQFLDQVGIVVETYFLATDFEPDEVVMVDIGMPTEKLTHKYRRKRMELLFRPFQRVEARRIWGAETPIELFLMQELARHGIFGVPQMLIMEDGGLFPSWYHLWQDLEFRHAPGLISEVDLYFADERVAVFCDGAHHQRAKQRVKDAAIEEKLAKLGITAVRVSGAMINRDLEAAGAIVRQALGRA